MRKKKPKPWAQAQPPAKPYPTTTHMKKNAASWLRNHVNAPKAET